MINIIVVLKGIYNLYSGTISLLLCFPPFFYCGKLRVFMSAMKGMYEKGMVEEGKWNLGRIVQECSE